MKQMKTLTVNGVTYEIADPDAAHIDDAAVSPDTAWSSRNTVARLCPSIEENGAVVRCLPLEDYPMQVLSHIPYLGEPVRKVTLFQRGKNLFDISNESQYKTMNAGRWSVENGVLKVTGQGINAIWPIRGGTSYTISYKSSRTGASGGGVYVRAYDAAGQATVLAGNYANTLSGTVKVTVPADAVSLNILFYGTAVENDTENYALFRQVQVEVGDTATAYEPFRGVTRQVDLGMEISTDARFEYDWTAGVLYEDGFHLASYDPQPVTGLPGVNTLWSDTGDTAVTANADPRKLLEDLSEKVNTLTAAMTALTGV